MQMEPVHHEDGYFVSGHKERVFTHSFRGGLQQPPFYGRRRSVGPVYGWRTMDDYRNTRTNQVAYYGGPRQTSLSGFQFQQPRNRRVTTDQRSRVFSQGSDLRNQQFLEARPRRRRRLRQQRGPPPTHQARRRKQSIGSQTNPVPPTPQRPQQQQRRFICQHCRAAFNSAKAITLHLKDHQEGEKKEGSSMTYVTNEVNLHKCPFCPFAFMSGGELNRHKARCRASQQFSFDLKLIHPGNENYLVSCPLCRSVTNLAHGLKRHMELAHPLARVSVSYECGICHKIFDGKSASSVMDEESNSETELALDAVIAHMAVDHTEQQIEELKKERSIQFIDEQLKTYERVREARRSRRRSGGRQNEVVTNVLEDLLNSVQTNEQNVEVARKE
ncbi:hypothetical protein ACOME3_003001 [Neoechinorhynchus agilis]